MGAVLHTLNIRLFPEQLIHVANHAEDQVIIVDPTLLPLLNPQLPQLSTVKHVIVTGDSTDGVEAPDGVAVHAYESLLADQPTTFDWPDVDERSAAAMCYTSGTTGKPKGAELTVGNLLAAGEVAAQVSRGTSDDRLGTGLPLFHVFGLTCALMAPVTTGASLALIPRFDPAVAAQTVRE